MSTGSHSIKSGGPGVLQALSSLLGLRGAHGVGSRGTEASRDGGGPGIFLGHTAPELRELVGQALFVSAFALFSLQFFLKNVSSPTLLGLSMSDLRYGLHVGVLVVLLCKAATQRTTPLRWLVALAGVVLGVAVYVSSGSTRIFWLFLFVACSQGVRVRHLAWTALLIWVPGIIITIGLANAGDASNVVAGRSSGITRYSMGFNHPNNFARLIFEVAMAYCVVCATRHRALIVTEAIVIALLCIPCWFVADARTFFVALIVLFFMCAADMFLPGPKSRRAAAVLFAFGAVFFVASSCYFMVAYDASNETHAAINTLMSQRLMLSHGYFTQMPLAAFGNSADLFESIYLGTEEMEFVIDNDFIKLFVNEGVVATVVILAGMLWWYVSAVRMGRYDIVMVGMTLFIVVGFTTSAVFTTCEDYFLIAAFSELLFDHDGPLGWAKSGGAGRIREWVGGVVATVGFVAEGAHDKIAAHKEVVAGEAADEAASEEPAEDARDEAGEASRSRRAKGMRDKHDEGVYDRHAKGTRDKHEEAAYGRHTKSKRDKRDEGVRGRHTKGRHTKGMHDKASDGDAPVSDTSEGGELTEPAPEEPATTELTLKKPEATGLALTKSETTEPTLTEPAPAAPSPEEPE